MSQDKLLTCPVCLQVSDSGFEFIQNYKSENRNFVLRECAHCQVQFWQPFKGPGKEWYEKDYENLTRREIRNKKYIKWLARHNWNTRQFLKSPPHKFLKGKKILDLGCGTGGFLLEAQNLGYEVYGVDFDQQEIQIAQQLGLKNVYSQDIIGFLKNSKDKFDVITGFEIIEHLDQPKYFLKLIQQILKPGGYLALSTPNRERFYGRINEPWDFPPHHLTRWNTMAFNNFFLKNGFEVINTNRNFPFDYFINKFRVGFGNFLRRMLKQKNSSRYPFFHKSYEFIYILTGVKDYLISKFFYLPALILKTFFNFYGAQMYILARKNIK